MGLVSRLSDKKYLTVPFAEISKYLSFTPNVDVSLIDPVMLMRLAAFARDYGKGEKLLISSGTRTIARQTEIFLERGGKYDKVKGYYWPDSVPPAKRTVAKPGKSFHNYGLAIDTDSLWAKAINKTEATKAQVILLKYGLFKPMTAGNKMSVLEDWHIQPYETLDVPLEKRAALAPKGLKIA